MKSTYDEDMVPADLELPIDGAFAQKFARFRWFNEDGTTKEKPPIIPPCMMYRPPPDPFGLNPCEVAVDGKEWAMQAMQRAPHVAANMACPCGQDFIVPIQRMKFGGLCVATGHRGYVLFGIAVTWCTCGRLLWATLGDTSWAQSMQDLLPTTENEDDGVEGRKNESDDGGTDDGHDATTGTSGDAG